MTLPQFDFRSLLAAARPNALGARAWALAGIVLVLDQITKAWILYGLDLPSKLRIELSPVFDLTMVWNQGVSFGMLQADSDFGRWFLVVFSLIVAVLLAAWVRTAERRLFAASVALIVGGAIGNAIDRIRFGAVADFLDFSGLGFPWVFNVADSGITVGAVLLLVDAWLSERRGGVGEEPGKG